LADFIKRVEQTKYFIAFFAKDLAFNRTLYASRGYESYLSRPVYIKRSYNLQPFQQYDNKVHNIRFLSYIHKKDINGKSKDIDRIDQSKF